jgi:hypothetical protein
VRSRQFERRRGVPESPREPVSETLAALLAPNRMTARDQVSAVGKGVCCGCG